MHLLVTGAAGFVMSVLGRQWLEAYPGAHLTVLDVAPLDEAAHRYFAPVAERLDVFVADLTRPESWRAALDGKAITHVAHGATITPISRGTMAEARREPEADQPARIIDVNVMGTVALLEMGTHPVHSPALRVCKLRRRLQGTRSGLCG
jgi:UDP-glucose 4-epimerase